MRTFAPEFSKQIYIKDNHHHMIAVNNLGQQFGKRVIFRDINLKFTSGPTAMASSVLTVQESLLLYAFSAMS